MDEPNFDGKIHAISKDYAAILNKTDIDIKQIIFDQLTPLSHHIKDFSNQYAEYLYQFNKEKVIKILEEKIYDLGLNGCTFDEDYQFIYRPPWVADVLYQFGTIAIKFKRSEKDNLDDKI